MIYSDIHVVIFDYNDIHVIIFDYKLYHKFLCHSSCAQLRRVWGATLHFLNLKKICNNIEKSTLQIPYLSV